MVVSKKNQLYINSLLLSIKDISNIYYTKCIQDLLFQLVSSFYHLVILVEMENIENVCQVIKAIRTLKKIPVLVLVSKNGEKKELYINMGADVVLSIDCDKEDLKLQIFALMRRYSEWEVRCDKRDNIVQRDQFIMCFSTRNVFWKGNELKLTKREFDFMYLLSSSPERIYTFSQIYKAVWNEYPQGNITNVIRCMIKRIKKKLKELDPEIPDMIHSVRDIGYYFKMDTPDT